MVTVVKHTSKSDTCLCVLTPYSIGHGLWEGVGPQEQSLRTLPESPQSSSLWRVRHRRKSSNCQSWSGVSLAMELPGAEAWINEAKIHYRIEKTKRSEWRINSRKFFQRGSLRRSVQKWYVDLCEVQEMSWVLPLTHSNLTNKLWNGFHFLHFRHEEVKLWKVKCFVPYSMSICERQNRDLNPYCTGC